jgi:hypothetical protein
MACIQFSAACCPSRVVEVSTCSCMLAALKRKRPPGDGTGQQTATGDQGDPSLNRKRTHATIS